VEGDRKGFVMIGGLLEFKLFSLIIIPNIKLFSY
jgi:hypothetical protein